LNGEGWLDPSTVRMMFDVVNDDNVGKTLKPIGRCHGFFRRLRISVRGQIIEDIQDYTRVHHMFNVLQGPQVRLNESCEGFGYTDDAEGLATPGTLPGIGGSTGAVKPSCGLFQQTKYIPLRYCPIEIELELADNNEPIVSTLGTVFTAANTSLLWHLEQCQIKCDIITLDNALDNSYVNHLLGGNTLHIVYNTYISSIQSIVSSDSTNVNVSRSLTALRSVFISFDKHVQEGRLTWYNKSWNNFYSPMAGNIGNATTIPKTSNNEIMFYNYRSVLNYYQNILSGLTLSVCTT
jgi:hypothetical protein